MNRIISSLIISLALFAVEAKPLFAQSEPMTEEAMKALAEPKAQDAAETGVKKTKYDNNDPVFRDIAKEFRCPTCTGLSVLESDAGFSVQIKEQVQEQLNLGKNHDQIMEYFTQRYGAWILREPPAKGWNVLAWAIPILLLCLGPILIWLMVWKRHRPVETHGVRPANVIIQEMQEKLETLKGVR